MITETSSIKNFTSVLVIYGYCFDKLFYYPKAWIIYTIYCWVSQGNKTKIQSHKLQIGFKLAAAVFKDISRSGNRILVHKESVSQKSPLCVMWSLYCAFWTRYKLS